jgi:integrase
MLTIFRRHLRDCPHRSRRYRRCQCPISVEGSLRGEKIRRALDLTSWEAASELVTGWNASGQLGVIKVDVPTVDEAVQKFFEDVAARGLKPPTVGKLKNLLEKRLQHWCRSRGFRLLKQLDVDAVRQFRASWPDGPISAYKNIERLRSFFSFCLEAGWIQKNPAKSLKPPRVARHEERVEVFTPEEIENILAAIDSYPARNSHGHENRTRIRAFILALQYTGLRIGDVVGLKKEHLKNDRIFLRTQKTGTKAYVPVPDVLVTALNGSQSASDYFFWTGNGLQKSAVSDWQRALRRLFKLANVTGHPHMFRHTFATTLLTKGVPIEDVAILLGHSTPLITAKYYSHFVKSRRDRLEERVREVWA